MSDAMTHTGFVLDRYRPLAQWFHHPAGIHGLTHAARVLVFADTLAQALVDQDVAVDLEAVRWAAVVHDVGRVDDGKDPQHGERSAAWLLGNAATVAPRLTTAQVQTVAAAVRWHVPWDDQVPTDARTDEWRCLKDADGLDRLRLGAGKLDPGMLRSQQARRMVGAAGELVDATPAGGLADGWELVRGEAVRRGLWR